MRREFDLHLSEKCVETYFMKCLKTSFIAGQGLFYQLTLDEGRGGIPKPTHYEFQVVSDVFEESHAPDC